MDRSAPGGGQGIEPLSVGQRPAAVIPGVQKAGFLEDLANAAETRGEIADRAVFLGQGGEDSRVGIGFVDASAGKHQQAGHEAGILVARRHEDFDPLGAVARQEDCRGRSGNDRRVGHVHEGKFRWPPVDVNCWRIDRVCPLWAKLTPKGKMRMDGSEALSKSYAPLDERTVAPYVAAIPSARATLGGAPEAWRVREVGDGNLNLVFIVEGPAGGVVVKQALPYLRLVGEGWPLPLARSYFESLALAEQARAAPGLVPHVHAADRVGAAITMEYLTPHIVLRKALIRGQHLPLMAGHMAEFLAATLFKTSDLHLPAARKKALMVEFCANTALCKITEDLVFTDPYRMAPANRWTSPQLDADAAQVRADAPLKVAVQRLKAKFLGSAEAMIHGDLHTGSIMVTADDTRAIDPEFACFGPMGFDVGALLGNLLIATIAHPAHAADAERGRAYQAWILDQAEAVWTGFGRRFRALWAESGTGDAYTAELFADAAGKAALTLARDRYMANLFADSLGFAGCKMIRRVLGLAHVEDLESIADPDRRAAAERRVLALGRALILERETLRDFAAVRGLLARISGPVR